MKYQFDVFSAIITVLVISQPPENRWLRLDIGCINFGEGISLVQFNAHQALYQLHTFCTLSISVCKKTCHFRKHPLMKESRKP